MGHGENIINQLNSPRHINKNSSNLRLCKIVKTQEFLKDFLDGKFYMSTLEELTKIEYNQLTKGQHDDFEGIEEYLEETEVVKYYIDTSLEQPLLIQTDNNYVPKSGNLKIYSGKLGFKENRYKNVFCMFSIWQSDNGELIKIDDRLSKDFGDFCVVIDDLSEFFERIVKGILNSGFNYNTISKIGFVNYIDIKNRPYTRLGVFRKRVEYIYQQEFRIVMDIKDNKKAIKYFNIGDIRDIVSVINTSDLIKLSN